MNINSTFGEVSLGFCLIGAKNFSGQVAVSNRRQHSHQPEVSRERVLYRPLCPHTSGQLSFAPTTVKEHSSCLQLECQSKKSLSLHKITNCVRTSFYRNISVFSLSTNFKSCSNFVGYIITQTGSASALTTALPLSSSSSDQSSSSSSSSSDEASESTSTKSSGGPAKTSQKSVKKLELSFLRLKQHKE